MDWNNWVVLTDAIYYVRRPEPNRPELARYDIASGETETLESISDLLHKSGLWVSRDESEFLYTQVTSVEADLMLIESGT